MPSRPTAQSAKFPHAHDRDNSSFAVSGETGGQAALEYAVDAWQRSVLFLDALRERADNMLTHERAGLPTVLNFEHEMLLDARTFDPPVNYALVRIVEVEGFCVDDCLDESKPPVIVMDPRAGHGPGIGGFKRDSEVGIALQEGHAVYFIIFYPEPCDGQTLAHVLHTLRRFVEHVAERHQGCPPVLYGNCQAGWAAALLAADCEGLSGPTVLNGSPLSYWAGEHGLNPMRVLGGLVGGTWLTHFFADLGGGRFDGAWLVENFENLKPESTLWDKYANLFANADTERERFLAFERWWNGFHHLSREEIVAIVEDLFVGNKLEQGQVRLCPGCIVDLRHIRNPVVIFASYGDNLTPPHQALGWIPVVYANTEELKAAEQRIVYLTNPHVGHLGIFVSAKVARLEHRAILQSLDEIERLVSGLYEMKIDNSADHSDGHKPTCRVTFEERRVEDLRFTYPEKLFERARGLSELNEAAYGALVSPWVHGAVTANPWAVETGKWLHPMRWTRWIFSSVLNPWMWSIETMASAVREHRTPPPAENPFTRAERDGAEIVSKTIETMRELRDQGYEQLFRLLYG